MADAFCENLVDYGNVKIFTNDEIGAVMIVLGACYFFMSLLIMFFINYQEKQALRGDDRAVQSVIFPIFVKMLWMNAIINIYIAMIMICFDFNPYEVSSNEGGVWAFAIMYALQHWLIEGVAILLMQKGLGRNAAFRSLRIAILWGLFSLFVHWGLLNSNRTLAFSLDFCWNMLLLFFYSFLWLAPLKRWYRRPAAIFYAQVWAIYRLTVIIFSAFYFIPATAGVAPCFYTFGSLFPFALFEPILMYYTFLQDSKWWQGLEISSQSSKKRKSNNENIKSPLYGIDLNVNSAQNLAASIDNLGISSSFNFSKKEVKLLNFAYITLDKSKMLGTGSFSRVYLGKYRQRPCAIKLVYTMDVTKEIIARIAAEAEILSSIKSRNVVEILGVSVLPPSVCILLELCAYGTLGDIVHGAGYAALGTTDPDTFMKHFVIGGPMIGKGSKQNLNISWTDRLYLAIGCAKGIAAVHALRSDICHRDVKSFNFLVDEHFNAKISDLELGTTRVGMKKEHQQKQKQLRQQQEKPYWKPQNVLANAATRLSAAGSPLSFSKKSSSSRNSDGSSRPSDMSDSEIEIPEAMSSGEIRATKTFDDQADQLGGSDFLANWSAPEVISDARHSQASDIYSFGLVLWEILIGTPPFNEIRTQTEIRRRVLNDIRPAIPECFLTPPYEVYFLPLVDLIRRCWSKEPLLRPSISFVLEKLQALYQKQCYNICFETSAVEQVMIASEQQNSNDIRAAKARSYSFRNSLKNNSPLSLQKIAFYSNITDTQCSQITNLLQDEASIIERFLETEEAWCLCLPDSTFVTVWCSPLFEEYFQTPGKEIVGKSILSHPCFDPNVSSFANGNASPRTLLKETESNNKKKKSFFQRYSFGRNDKENKRKDKIQIFFSNLQEMKIGQECHTMLELANKNNNNKAPSKPPSRSQGSHDLLPGSNNSNNGPAINPCSLFSLHCFPIVSKATPISPNINNNNNNSSFVPLSANVPLPSSPVPLTASNLNSFKSPPPILPPSARESSASFDASTSPSTASMYHGNMRASFSTNPSLANPNALIHQYQQQQQQQQYRDSERNSVGERKEGSSFVVPRDSNTIQSIKSASESFSGPPAPPSISNINNNSNTTNTNNNSQSIALVAILFNRLKDL
jgi:hypothetical protein